MEAIKKEVYFDADGNIIRESHYDGNFSGVVSKVPIKIEVRLNRNTIDDMLEISRKIEALRNEHPFTEVHFIIEY